MQNSKRFLNKIKTQMQVLDDYSDNEEYLLVSKTLDLPMGKILLRDNFSMNERQRIIKRLNRRLKGEPLNKIFETADFYGLEFSINNFVLAPRKETEILVEQAIKQISKRKGKVKVLDLCTGSGCIGLSIKNNFKDKVDLVISDVSNKALTVAKKNISKLGLNDVVVLRSNMFERLKVDQKFDIITCNPPYVSYKDYETLPDSVKFYDPKISLVGGVDGLDYYKNISKNLKNFLKKNGKAFIEIGYNQKKDTDLIFKDYKRKFIKDYSGNDRVIILSL